MATPKHSERDHILPTATIIVGGLGTILTLLIAFGVNLSPDQHTALEGAAALLLLVLGVWFHPKIPVGIRG